MSQPDGLPAPLVLSARDWQSHRRPDTKTRHVFLVLVSSLVAGIGSGWLLLGERPPLGVVSVGPWQSFPRIGSSDVDPYGRAILARGPHLPLAAGEGIQLATQSDSQGAALEGRCRYLISGVTLPSRGWTLVVTDRFNRVLTGAGAAALSDADLLTDEGGEVRMSASSTIAPGTWLKLPREGRFGLILRFYDTPSSAAIGQLPVNALPRIERLSCTDAG